MNINQNAAWRQKWIFCLTFIASGFKLWILRSPPGRGGAEKNPLGCVHVGVAGVFLLSWNSEPSPI
jgi:hypothetical protein